LPTKNGRSALVTGAAGFLGRHLSERLARSGVSVVGVDCRPIVALNGDGFHHLDRFVLADVTDAGAMSRLFQEQHFDWVFHLAGLASVGQCARDPALALEVNVGGTRNVLEASRDSERFVFLSSAAVYGPAEQLPITEDQPRRGTDPYAISKIRAEELCELAREQGSRSILVARNFNSFGEFQASEYIVPSLIGQAVQKRAIRIRNGAPIRDFSYVENTIDALLRLVERGNGSTYNVGSGRGVQIADLARMVRDIIDPDIPIVDAREPTLGSSALVAENRLLRATGWSEAITLEEGIARTISTFQPT
jgi:nucleoside-diphosphate-sugar epimerase